MTIVVAALSKAHVLLATDGFASAFTTAGQFSGGQQVRKLYTDLQRRIGIAIAGLGIVDRRALIDVVEESLSDYKDALAATTIAGWLGHKTRPAIARALGALRARIPDPTALYGSTLFVGVSTRRGPSLAQVRIESATTIVTPFIEPGVYVSMPTCLVEYFKGQRLPDSESEDLTDQVVHLVHAAVIAERQKHGGVNVDCGEPIQTAELRRTGVVGKIWKSEA